MTHSMPTSTPTSEPTPTPQEAARRLANFTAEVQRKHQSSLIKATPKQKEQPNKPIIPMRSRRIAAQQMDHISASKQGEALLVKKMGVLPAVAAPSAASRRTFNALFEAKLSVTEVEAFDVLFPATKTRVGRTTRRPMAVVA